MVTGATRRRLRNALVVIATVAVGAACDNDATQPPASSEAPGVVARTSAGERAENPAVVEDARDAELSCSASVSGTLMSAEGDLTYTNAALSVEVAHASESGCVNAVDVLAAHDAGCRLHLQLGTAAGAWTLLEGTLVVDEACETSMPDTVWGEYVLDPEASTGGLVGQPTVPGDSNACLDASTLSLTGLAHFTQGEETLTLNLNGLALTGTVPPSVASEGACPEAVPVCADVTCGQDAYGNTCGTCEDGEACIDGGCRVWNCPPEGPFGTKPGESLTDRELRDCDGNTVYLHELCGADAAYFNLLAGW